VIGLAPTEPTWDILAFNLACHFARTNDRRRLLAMTKQALTLGKSPAQFLGDDDFEAFVDDEEFLAVLKSVE